MCGRITLYEAEKAMRQVLGSQEWQKLLEFYQPSPRFNLAPTHDIPIAVGGATREARLVRWGFVPYYERQKPKPQALVNKQSETALTSGAFKRAVQKHRCLVPANGYYEWRKAETGKIPYYIRRRDREPFLLGGIWEPAAAAGAPGSAAFPAGFCVFTTQPNEITAKIHHRMPVIVAAEHYDAWLSGEPLTPEAFAAITRPFPSKPLEAFAVSTIVNSARNEGPELIEPAPEATAAPPPVIRKEQLELGL